MEPHLRGRSLARRALAVLLAVSATVTCLGPRGTAGQEAESWPEPDPADVESMDAIIAALYDVISGPPGPRDWDRLRSLHVPEARLIPSGPDATGTVVYRVWSVNDYIEQVGGQLQANGFFEREIARVTERFANLAHVFSTYESRHRADDPEPFQRGINSLQLLYDGDRWWIVQVMWTPETAGREIPPRYLPDR